MRDLRHGWFRDFETYTQHECLYCGFQSHNRDELTRHTNNGAEIKTAQRVVLRLYKVWQIQGTVMRAIYHQVPGGHQLIYRLVIKSKLPFWFWHRQVKAVKPYIVDVDPAGGIISEIHNVQTFSYDLTGRE